MASFSTFHQTIPFTAGWNGSYDKTSHTSTKIVYDLDGFIATILTGSGFGIVFNATASGIELDVQDSTEGDDAEDPSLFTSNTITGNVSSGIVTVGQTIYLKASNGDARAEFTVPDFGWSSGSSGGGGNINPLDEHTSDRKKVSHNFW